MLIQLIRTSLKTIRKSILLIVELTLILLGLMAILVIITELIHNKNQLLGYDYQNVYQLQFDINRNIEGNEAEFENEFRALLNTIETYPNVKKLGYWHYNPPFSKQKNHIWGELKYNSTSVKGDAIDFFAADKAAEGRSSNVTCDRYLTRAFITSIWPSA